MRSRSDLSSRANRRAEKRPFTRQGELQVLEHRVALEDGGALELAANAALGDLVLAELREVGVVAHQEDRAGVGLGLARDDVHQRGLAGAVRADDAAQLALVEHQRQLGDGLEAVERRRSRCRRRAALAPFGEGVVARALSTVLRWGTRLKRRGLFGAGSYLGLRRRGLFDRAPAAASAAMATG